eukprot:3783829-Rhodomonas_salina.2
MVHFFPATGVPATGLTRISGSEDDLDVTLTRNRAHRRIVSAQSLAGSGADSELGARGCHGGCHLAAEDSEEACSAGAREEGSQQEGSPSRQLPNESLRLHPEINDNHTHSWYKLCSDCAVYFDFAAAARVY